MTNKGTERTELRASQLETLRAIGVLDGERGTPAAIGGLVCASIRATKERCERLSLERYVFVQLDRDKRGYYPAEYGLTDKGREAIR